MTKEEAIKVIKDWNLNNDKIEVLSVIIPELKESEDEKIRKQLLNWFKDCNWDAIDNGTLRRDDIIAWLEKQKTTEEALRYLKENHSPSEMSDFQAAMNIAVAKAYNKGYTDVLEKQVEQKPADTPKFKVGDWIITNDELVHEEYRVCRIEKIEDDRYYIDNGDFLAKDTLEAFDYHLWSIQDAKEGDVLVNKYGAIFINAGSNNERGTVDCYCYLSVRNEFFIEDHKTGSWLYKETLKPATKEQRELLFSKMKEAGYELDAEKKEMRKIEQKSAAYFYCKCVGTTLKCGDCVRNHLNSKYKIEDIKTWMTPTSCSTKQCSDYISVKWSEEDNKRISSILLSIEYCKEQYPNLREYQYDIDWLKSLKERVQLV